jgi:hypothetical protein
MRGRAFDGKHLFENAAKLMPFPVVAVTADVGSDRFKAAEGGNLGAQLLDGAGGGRLVGNLGGACLVFVARGVFEVIEVVGIELQPSGCHARDVTASDNLLFAVHLFKTLFSTAKRLVNGFG